MFSEVRIVNESFAQRKQFTIVCVCASNIPTVYLTSCVSVVTNSIEHDDTENQNNFFDTER